jgi:hypothetical protein
MAPNLITHDLRNSIKMVIFICSLFVNFMYLPHRGNYHEQQKDSNNNPYDGHTDRFGMSGNV